MAPQAAPPPPPPRSTLQNSNLITERGEYRPASNESETKGQGERSLFIPAAYDLEEKGEEGVRGTKGVKGISVPCISVWGAADVANTRLARNKNVGVRIYRNILVFKIETIPELHNCINAIYRKIASRLFRFARSFEAYTLLFEHAFEERRDSRFSYFGVRND